MKNRLGDLQLKRHSLSNETVSLDHPVNGKNASVRHRDYRRLVTFVGKLRFGENLIDALEVGPRTCLLFTDPLVEH